MLPKSVRLFPFACATAPMGTRQPPSSFRTRLRSAVISARVALSSTDCRILMTSLLPSLATIAIAPCPAAEGNWSSERRSVISLVMFMRSKPASAMTMPAISPFVTLPMRVSTLPRMGSTSKSGRMYLISASRRRLPVPTTAPFGNALKCDSVFRDEYVAGRIPFGNRRQNRACLLLNYGHIF